MGPDLERVVSAIPGGGERREGQREMADAVSTAIETHRHLFVQAGTGTGKTLAYLVPAIVSGRKTVVATATKALQDQLATKDLPFLDRTLGRDFSWTVLKGRSNYVCRQRIAEVQSGEDGQLDLGVDSAPASVRDEVRRLVAWAEHTETGDRAELAFEPSVAAWSAVSVGWDECPGALRCPMGDECLAEAARAKSEAADVVVVNTHLYGMHLAMRGTLLPEHELVVIDEAHQLEEIVSATTGIALAPSRFRFLARVLRAVIVDPELVASLDDMADRWADAIGPHLGERLPPPMPDDIAEALALARTRIERASTAVSAIPADAPDSVTTRKARAQKAILAVFEAVDIVSDVPTTMVAWVEGTVDAPRLEVAPIDVREVLGAELWPQHTVVLTSATLPRTLPIRLGAPDDTTELVDVGSPFDYEEHALLYCAAHVPDPRRPGYEAALHDELAALIEAAGGRTLALFTSWRAMQSAATELRGRVEHTILAQGELPKPKLLSRFTEEHASCLFATMGFWQGIDVPGPSLSMVTIDRLPFPRPDDPLLQARRERAGANAFAEIDLPRAAVLLAQATGRLIRTATDRGVVAVFDSRLATAGYRWDLVRALPPMRRTRHRDEVETFLHTLH
jgi:ATP-dependent DNA helicase DinG